MLIILKILKIVYIGTRILISSLFIISSCSSIAEEEKTWSEILNFVIKEKKGFQKSAFIETAIIESSSTAKQEWISNPKKWIIENDKEHKNYRYFLYTTSLQANRKLCEDLARAHAMKMILNLLPLEKQKKIKNPVLIQGAQKLKSYWKLIDYKATRHDTKEEVGGRATICSTLFKISVQNIMAID